eukprot:CAMPEP_0202943844 /NCGR_PEP_ID=MMETSP1395-20130829/4430_1 /ASSEMBLY_ACC=CAM_ASM_000871 /TAXON_ID=5961 /ORGANISM="Blepharisma japonicum, Strain Stock R1072" /LENGTH=166 /DNA_ID=CAMNT_0049641841 /DNA_START=28 /DNA_END=528 /DNA_ORIENTATION=-
MSLDDIIKKNKEKGKQKKQKLHVKNKVKGFNKKGVDKNDNRGKPKKFSSDKPKKSDKKNPTQKGNTQKGSSQKNKPPKGEKSEGSKKTGRVFVKGLDFGLTNGELRDIFIKIGPLKTCGINWDQTGKSKGTAEVEYQKVEDATKAVKNLNGTVVRGRSLVVKYSKI